MTSTVQPATGTMTAGEAFAAFIEDYVQELAVFAVAVVDRVPLDSHGQLGRDGHAAIDRHASSIQRGITTGMICSMDKSIKVKENRLRRMAERQGLRLLRNPRRDPHATDYGSYMLTDANKVLVADFGWDHPAFPESGSWLNEVEAYLTRPRQS